MELERFGPYLLVRLLARGGMGELHLAKKADTPDAPLVVVKRILPELIDRVGFTEMFLSEGRIAALIDHPNVVHVHALGEVAGSYFMCMEYVAGADLGTLLRRLDKPLELPLALLVMRGVCAGIAYAHQAVGPDGTWLRVVHRDINPYNILISYSGEVKITDFGVAKAHLENRQQTRLGVIKGKLGYLSPEQARGLAVDQRSDIYLLGLVLFELTVGRPAISGQEVDMVALAAQAQVPRPTAVNKHYPPELERIILRAVAREPANRYHCASDLERDLLAFEASQGIAATPGDLATLIRQLFAAELEESRRALAPLIHARIITGEADVDPLEATVYSSPSVEEQPVSHEPLAFEEGSSLRATTKMYRRATPPPPAAEGLRLIVEKAPSSQQKIRSAPGRSAPHVDEVMLSMPETVVEMACPPIPRAATVVLAEPANEPATAARKPRSSDRPRLEELPEPRPQLEARRRAVRQPPPPARHPPPRRVHRWVLRAAVAIGLLGLAALAYTLRLHEAVVSSHSPRVAPDLQRARPDPKATALAPLDSSVLTPDSSLRATRDSTVTPDPPDSSVLVPDMVRVRALELSQVQIVCTPKVMVTWRNTQLGTVPLIARLPPGRHVLVLRSRELGLQTTREVQVTRGERTSVRFELGRGKLDLRVRPWAKVEVDGKDAGTTPILPFDLWEGRHEVRLFNPTLGVEHRARVVIKPGQTFRLVHRFAD